MPDETSPAKRAPLAEDPGATGDAVRAYRDAVQKAAPENGPWLRLESRIDAEAHVPRRSPTRTLLLVAAALFVIVGLNADGLIGLMRARSQAPVAEEIAPTLSPTASVAPTAMPASPRDDAPIALRDGLTNVTPALDVIADVGASATVAMTDPRRTVRVAKGRIEVRSREADPERRVRVIAEPYAFDDVGTVFAVQREGALVELSVREGTVLVSQSGATIATIAAGQTWRSRAVDPQSAPSAQVAPPAASAASCRALVTAGNGDAAIGCYAGLSRGTDLTAQTALYELASLRRDRGDTSGALAEYRAYQSRFPGGPLETEAALSEIELLAKAGRHQEALDRSAALLAKHPRFERASELRLLRGNIYRESFNDLAKASIEYDLASSGTSPASAEALFLRGTCAEGMRDVATASARYQAYLARGHLPREAEAKRRLEAIANLKR